MTVYSHELPKLLGVTMCCRYYIEHDDPDILHILERVNRSPLIPRFQETGDSFVSDGEIWPTAVVPAIATGRSGQVGFFPMKWGYTLPGARPLFNARAETAGVKPTFREGWAAHRCVLPASWYYEWQHEPMPNGKSRVTDKYAIRRSDGHMAWLCGLYRLENNLPHFVILTREPSDAVRRIHDRMPLILPREAIGEWVNPRCAPESLLPRAVTSLIAEKADKEKLLR